MGRGIKAEIFFRRPLWTTPKVAPARSQMNRLKQMCPKSGRKRAKKTVIRGQLVNLVKRNKLHRFHHPQSFAGIRSAHGGEDLTSKKCPNDFFRKKSQFDVENFL